MSNEKMQIPKKLKVGYQNRSDTYTGKLAYVIYYDEKGELRKVKSWSDWCDKKCGENEYENVPTSGFVLNKKVGDYKSDWNHRMAHIRVYDPRGFEFEITVENLLYILQECTSVKGKGLDGEFVYAWDKKDLVLLPVSSQEYVSCAEFTAGLSKKVSKSDMKEGCVYITKKQEHVIYLGKQQWFEGNYYFPRENKEIGVAYKFEDKGTRHVFAFIGEDESKFHKWFCDTGFTKISSKVSDVISTEYAEKFEEFKNSFQGSGVKFPDFKPNNEKTERIYGNLRVIVMLDKEFFEVNLFSKSSYWYGQHDETIKLNRTNKVAIVNDEIKFTPCDKNEVEMRLSEFNKLQKYDLFGKITEKNLSVKVSF
jgi:hypothetical protein